VCKRFFVCSRRVRCRRKESSRSLSHLLMSFLFLFVLGECGRCAR